jgi:hypothetical protein
MLSMAGCTGAQSSQAAVSEDLFAQARSLGRVHVIVTLRVADDASVATVDSTKRAVLAEVAGTPHRVVRDLARLPQLVLEASEETLRVLAGSPHVLRVDESVPRRPQP